MKQQTQLVSWALNLILKSVITSAKWAAVARLRLLERCVDSAADQVIKENLILRQKVAELDGLVSILRSQLDGLVSILRSQLSGETRRRHLSVKERLFVLWHMEFFGIPKRRAREYYGIACSTIYRWLAGINRPEVGGKEPANKTPADVVKLVWEIARSNPSWGRLRIAHQIALLRVFISASTVRNILRRPRPPGDEVKPQTAEAHTEPKCPKHIRADHPNHVWSADLTTVRTWIFCRTHVLAAIDHFSRKLVALVPLERPDTASIIAALGSAFQRHGCPKHFVTDQGSVFTAPTFAAFLVKHDVKHRTGAVGKHGSISITERVLLSLKCEWLRRVALIRGFDHLAQLCSSFVLWMNEWRPHQGLGGAHTRASVAPAPTMCTVARPSRHPFHWPTGRG